MKFYEVGEKLFRSGDAARGIPACMACHGPGRRRQSGPGLSRIGGQQAWYARVACRNTAPAPPPRRDPHLFNIMAQRRQAADR